MPVTRKKKIYITRCGACCFRTHTHSLNVINYHPSDDEESPLFFFFPLPPLLTPLWHGRYVISRRVSFFSFVFFYFLYQGFVSFHPYSCSVFFFFCSIPYPRSCNILIRSIREYRKRLYGCSQGEEGREGYNLLPELYRTDVLLYVSAACVCVAPTMSSSPAERGLFFLFLFLGDDTHQVVVVVLTP